MKRDDCTKNKHRGNGLSLIKRHHAYKYGVIDIPSLAYLRACIRDRNVNHALHAAIGSEVCELTATVLVPPTEERERNHDTGAVYDAHKTVRCNSEPL